MAQLAGFARVTAGHDGHGSLRDDFECTRSQLGGTRPAPGSQRSLFVKVRRDANGTDQAGQFVSGQPVWRSAAGHRPALP